MPALPGWQSAARTTRHVVREIQNANGSSYTLHTHGMAASTAFAGKRLKITQLGGHRTNGNRPPLRRPSSGYACGMSVCCFSCCRRDVSSSLVSPRRSHSYDDEDPTNGRQRLYPPYPSSASLDSASLGVPTPQSTVAIYGLRLRSQVNISILPNNFPVRLGYYPCGVVCLLGRVTGRDEPEPVPRERP